MDNNLVRLKLRQRLNKLASNDFTNLDCWQEAELINKAQLNWVRRNLHGGNIYKEGDEQSTTRVDDFQILLKQENINGSTAQGYFQSQVLPSDYMKFKRVSVKAYSKDCETPRSMVVHLVEEANVDKILSDELLKPSFKWAETIGTLIDNRLRIYTNNEFFIKSCSLTYYRFPVQIAFDGCRDWNDAVQNDQELEFKDDIIELILDEAVKIAGADIQDFNTHQRAAKSVEESN